MYDLTDFEHTPGSNPEELARFDLNDYGNAMRLIRLAGGAVDEAGAIDISHIRLLWLPSANDWVAFNGRYWDRETGGAMAMRMAQMVGVKLQAVVNDLVVAHGLAETVAQKFIDSCGSHSACNNMLSMAKPHLTVRIEVFDRDPMVLNCRNGTLALRGKKGEPLQVELRSHAAADRITRFIDLDYDRAAVAPLFDATLATALPEDDKRQFFQRAVGYTATGHTKAQAFFMCQGLGRDGKSTLIGALRKTLGTYAAAADAKTFLDIGQVASSAASPDLAELAGDIRLVALSEAKRDALLNEALLKQWTGEEPVPARALNSKPFKFIAVGKLWWQFNGWPKAQGNDDGLWRRMYPIPFENQIDAKDVDEELPVKLESEQPGILNWIIAGIADWHAQGGLRAPPCVIEARERYRKTSSPFMDWLDTQCIYGKAAKGQATSAKELLAAFKEWCEAQGHEKVMSATAFGRALGERQINPIKRNGNIYRTPIRLKTLGERASDDAASDASQASATLGVGAPTPFEDDPAW